MKGGPRAEWWAYMMEGAHRILDVGCGFGFPSFYLASCGYEVVGIDPSPSQIAVAERYRREEGASYCLEYRVIEQTVLPFEDDSFDGATFSSSLECVGDPEALMREVIRVLKPGSPVAIDEEERGSEPETHPVWEHRGIVVIDDVAYLRITTRVCDPYLDRYYMIRLMEDGKLTGHFRKQAPAGSFKWGMTLEETGLSLEQVLSEAVEGEYGEAPGYDAYVLKDFLEKMGFTDLKFWTHNDGGRFAEELQAAGVLADMPDDIRAVSRALVRSIHPLSTPTTMVSCKSP
jgi:ubiquinone/menaquinone biosynthesis C-methylase UbiE